MQAGWRHAAKRPLQMFRDPLAGHYVENGKLRDGIAVEDWRHLCRFNHSNVYSRSTGNKKGYFEFGNSSTLQLVEPGRVRLADNLIQQNQNRTVLYARVGDRLGTIN